MREYASKVDRLTRRQPVFTGLLDRLALGVRSMDTLLDVHLDLSVESVRLLLLLLEILAAADTFPVHIIDEPTFPMFALLGFPDPFLIDMISPPTCSQLVARIAATLHLSEQKRACERRPVRCR